MEDNTIFEVELTLKVKGDITVKQAVQFVLGEIIKDYKEEE